MKLIVIFFILQAFLLTKSTVISEIDITRGLVDVVVKNCMKLRTLLKDDYLSISQSTSKPNPNDLQVYLYSKTDTVIFNLSNGNNILTSSHFNKNLPITIFTHGYHTHINGEDVTAIVSALLEKGGTNVMAIDTKDHLSWDYLRASTNTIFIAEYLGFFLVHLHEGGILTKDIHLIGFSLGAHISGMASKFFTKATSLKIGRLTGLDVANPCFIDENSNDYKFTKDDAEFVDVMHTNGGILGIAEPLGHVDFYPNGGSAQPFCFIIGQSHHRAWDLFASSIRNPQGFPAVSCEDYNSFLDGNCSSNPVVYMGYETPRNTKGIYFLKTSGMAPFYLGENTLNINSLFNPFSILTRLF